MRVSGGRIDGRSTYWSVDLPPSIHVIYTLDRDHLLHDEPTTTATNTQQHPQKDRQDDEGDCYCDPKCFRSSRVILLMARGMIAEVLSASYKLVIPDLA
jgi:hypothetical protein